MRFHNTHPLSQARALGLPAHCAMAAAAGGSKVEVDAADVVRLVLQFLQESNLQSSMQALQQETGVSLNTVLSVDVFKQDIQTGRWDRVLEQVRKLRAHTLTAQPDTPQPSRTRHSWAC